MTSRIINVAVGAIVNGVVTKSQGMHAGSALGNASLTYDDTVILSLAQMRSVLDELWQQAQANASLKH